MNVTHAYLAEKARIELGRRWEHYGSTERRPIYWKESTKEVLGLDVTPTTTAHKHTEFFTFVILTRKKINTFLTID